MGHKLIKEMDTEYQKKVEREIRDRRQDMLGLRRIESLIPDNQVVYNSIYRFGFKCCICGITTEYIKRTNSPDKNIKCHGLCKGE